MKVTHARIWNFGSYEHLAFDFADQGLTLLAGPTGAGKSTLCDVIPWVLFGVTAKNGAADDVKSWYGGCTTGIVRLDFGNEYIIEISRHRGPNDLSFMIYKPLQASVPNRGKDLLDTQKRINELLGMDAELYLAGAYFHEFSQTASFFTAPAKVRRLLTEQLVDLTLAKTLTGRLADTKKERKKYAAEVDKMLSEARIHLGNAQSQFEDDKCRSGQWLSTQDAKISKVQHSLYSFDKDKAKRIKELEASSDAFEVQVRTNIILREQEIADYAELIISEVVLMARIEQLSTDTIKLSAEVCLECGAKKDSHKHLVAIKRESELKAEVVAVQNAKRAVATLERMLKIEHGKENPYHSQVVMETSRVNTFQAQLDALTLEENPYVKALERAERSVASHASDLADLQVITDDLKTELTDLDTLSNVIDSFRGAIVKRAIKDLENKTNSLIAKYFDAEIRVTFDIAASDKLDVTIVKDSNECSYAQLSKGQRQLLKLCFGVSVMKVVANHHAVKFDAIFLDEFADGCDEAIKAKSFRLLQELALEYSSVFAIDHSEGLVSELVNQLKVSDSETAGATIIFD